MVGSLSWPSPTRSSLLWTGGRSLSAIAGNPHWKMSQCTQRGEREMRFTRSAERMKRALGEQGSLFFHPRSSRSLPRAAPRLAQISPVPPPLLLLFHLINRCTHPCPMTVNSHLATTSSKRPLPISDHFFLLTVPLTHRKNFVQDII